MPAVEKFPVFLTQTTFLPAAFMIFVKQEWYLRTDLWRKNAG
jgi:hypothetical protein